MRLQSLSEMNDALRIAHERMTNKEHPFCTRCGGRHREVRRITYGLDFMWVSRHCGGCGSRKDDQPR